MFLLLAFSFTFGVTLELGHLLQTRRYRWFGGALVATGALSAALGVAMLYFSDPYLHLLWMGVLASWVLRGRVLSLGGALMGVSMGLYLALEGPGLAYDPAVLIYFALASLVLGGAHDLLRRRNASLPAPLEWFFAKDSLHWYLMAAVFFLVFEFDQALLLSVYGFVQGQAYLRDEDRLAKLHSWGIKKQRPSA